MFQRIALLSGLLFCVLNADAALPDTIRIPFASSSAELSPEATARLDSLLKTLHNIPQAYTVSVTGHTDNTGSDAQNKALGLKRAESAAGWFRKNGFTASAISKQSHSSSTPVAANETENGKALNRRCEIVIALKPVNVQQAFGIKPAEKKQKIDATRGGSFTMASGTKVTVPPGAFVTAEGKPVRGEVELRYQEYRDPADFILSGIPMSFVKDGEFLAFNSDGMFTLRATAGGSEVQLARDSSIKVELQKVQGLPNAGIYRFDSIPQTWNDQTAQHGQNMWQVNNGNKPCASHGPDGPVCEMEYQEGYMMAVRLGATFIEKGIIIDLQQPDIAFAKALPDEDPSTFYVLKRAKSKKRYTDFQIAEIGPGKQNLKAANLITFRNYHKNNEGLRLPDFSETWTAMQLRDIKPGNSAMLTLFANSDTLDIPVTASGVKYLPKKDVPVMMQALQRGLENKSISENSRLLNKAEENKLYPSACRDSLFCFYSNSRPWMKKGEDTLKFPEWVDYFNSHHDSMRPRYVNRFRPPGNTDYLLYANNLQRKKEQQLASMLGVYGPEVSSSALQTAFRNVNVSTMGVWNCDQIQRLEAPVYVKAQYVDENNKPLQIVKVWLIDSKINGALSYEGSSGNLSPYHFPYSPFSKNTLLAIDAYDRTYIFSTDAFQQLSSTQSEKYTFRMKNAGRPQNKEELGRMLVSR